MNRTSKLRVRDISIWIWKINILDKHDQCICEFCILNKIYRVFLFPTRHPIVSGEKNHKTSNEFVSNTYFDVCNIHSRLERENFWRKGLKSLKIDYKKGFESKFFWEVFKAFTTSTILYRNSFTNNQFFSSNESHWIYH